MPTKAPTQAPSAVPTTLPRAIPSAAPSTAVPSAVPVPSDAVLFARLGHSNCAQQLNYGPQVITEVGSADGTFPYYFSTNIESNVVTDEWLQVVTSDGSTELFRIYWKFDELKPVTQHIVDAVAFGVPVSYTVVDTANNGVRIDLSGFWKFSDSAGITASTLFTGATGFGFSSDDGAWGAGSGVIDGDSTGSTVPDFWGQANWNSGDNDRCGRVYTGSGYTAQYSSPVGYMYAIPSDRGLFAVTGPSACAENLPYGPQEISRTGSEDGLNQYYFSTNSLSNLLSDRWIQHVYLNGVPELRIMWDFTSGPKTVTERIVDAVAFGEEVTYQVEDISASTKTSLIGTWWFSGSAARTEQNLYSGAFGPGLSGDDGAWGAGSGIIDANSGLSPSFYGQANWNFADSHSCHKLYKNGVDVGTGTVESVFQAVHGKRYVFTITNHAASVNCMINLAEIQLYGINGLMIPTSMLSVSWSQAYSELDPFPLSNCFDGILTNFCHTADTCGNSWIEVISDTPIEQVVITNRVDCCGARIVGVQLEYFVYGDCQRDKYHELTLTTNQAQYTVDLPSVVTKRYVMRIAQPPSAGINEECSINLAEIRLFGSDGQQITPSSYWWSGSYSSTLYQLDACFDGSSQNFCATTNRCDNVWIEVVSDLPIEQVILDNRNGFANRMVNKFIEYREQGSCENIYEVAINTGKNQYIFDFPQPSAVPTVVPTATPSAVPTTAPTGVEEGFFARFGGGACAEKLPFGPELLTRTGSVDGLNPYYFSTNAALDVVSDNWLQIVTSDGINDLFRVLWHFSDSKSVTARMSSAATVGEAVIWTVVDTSNSGTEYILSGLWRFSSAAGANTTDLFVGASGSELSASGGAWGAATGVLDGGFGPVPTDFWGQGKFAGTDSACQEVFLAGNGTTQYPSPVTYMYSADPSPTTAPTAVPTTSVPTALPTVSPTDTLQPTVAPTELPLPVIFLEKFKSSHQFSMTPPATFFSDAEGDFFGINAVLGSGIHDFGIAGGSALLPDQAVQFLGVDGSFLHASHLDGSPGVVNPVELVWQGINVNGISELIFTGLFGAQSPAQFDDTDGILLEFSVDGGPRQTLISFSGETSLPCHPNCGISSNMREDSTSPTPRSSLYLGQTMRSYSKMRPVSTGQSLTLYLTISSDSGSKQLAVDELVLGMLVYLRHECTLVGSKKRVLLCMKQLLYLSIAYFVFSVSNTYFYPPR